MRILFGPEHDGLHIDPNEPNGYEWWYFDAISDDERYVLVVIFFLGTPMSPYYKAVVDNKNPLPKDWCGVFFSLHEKTANGYRERAYTYNLYTKNGQDSLQNSTGQGLNYFRDKPLGIQLGKTTLQGNESHNGQRFTPEWSICLNEPNLWLGSTQASLTFTSSLLLKDQAPIESEDEGHTWVCVAPDCQVKGEISLAGKPISFSGRGYHDHNFGRLPWINTQQWFWGRVHYPDGLPGKGGVYYALWMNSESDSISSSATKTFVATWDHSASFQYTTSSQIYPIQTKKGYPSFPKGYDILRDKTAQEHTLWRSSLLQHSPFYKRFKCTSSEWLEKGPWVNGIAEVFEPTRLCGPIISRMMWTRIRRRS